MDHAISDKLPFPIITANPNPPSKKPIGSDIIRVIIIVASVLALTGAIIGMAWFFLRPHKPDFVVSSLSLSSFNVSETQLKGNNTNILNITITNTNRNADLVIDPFQVYVYYHHIQLSVASVHSPINLDPMSLIKMNALLGVSDFSNSKVAGNSKAIEVNVSSLQDLPKLWTIVNGDFIVQISVIARFKALHQMLKWRMNLGVICRITDMRFSISYDIWDVYGFGFCDVFHEV